MLDLEHVRLQYEVLKLRERNRRLNVVLRLLLTLVRVLGGRLERRRLPKGTAKANLLPAIEHVQSEFSLRDALRALRLSPARLHTSGSGPNRRADRAVSDPCPTPRQSLCLTSDLLQARARAWLAAGPYVPLSHETEARGARVGTRRRLACRHDDY